MNNEHQILNHISENIKSTQRDLAHKTGMSLGGVNILLKTLVKKGLVKIEKLNSRSVKYLLTPKGFREKAELTYKSIVYNFRFIKSMEDKIESIVSDASTTDSEILLSGDKDEVYEILINKLKSLGVNHRFIDNIDGLKIVPDDKHAIVITWKAKEEKDAAKKDQQMEKARYVNLLDII